MNLKSNIMINIGYLENIEKAWKKKNNPDTHEILMFWYTFFQTPLYVRMCLILDAYYKYSFTYSSLQYKYFTRLDTT